MLGGNVQFFSSSTGTKCLDSTVMNKAFKNENWIECKTVYDQNVSTETL